MGIHRYHPFQLGTAVLAMAAAAITPLVVAQVDSIRRAGAVAMSFRKALGSSAVCDPTSSTECASLIAGTSSNAVGDPTFQNNLIWLGEANPAFWNSPDTVQVWTRPAERGPVGRAPSSLGVFNWFYSQESSEAVSPASQPPSVVLYSAAGHLHPPRTTTVAATPANHLDRSQKWGGRSPAAPLCVISDIGIS